ncbi:MAG: enoyl-CoA hydratase-related protein [Pseudomonadales bacterium]|jgi:enoyl-CoA hydratase/carnithine racemase|nr:enoyl-CoA hydratase-related protein [Pseudomonadales bacterium]MDG1443718.1 enoyl-CoA hydratase-related protein [Pseudomonadales bacterium]
MSHLLFEISDHIATLTFNQPEKRNAYSPEMAIKLTEYLRQCDKDPDVRVVIITGAGDAFCVGLDLNDVRERGEDSTPVNTDGHPTQRVLRTYPFQISKPVICAINGAAGGFGAAYPLTCDIRLAADDAKIAFSFVKWGLIPEMGTTWILPKLIGLEKTADLLLTGRKVSGKEAAEMGLVLRSVPKASLMDEARKLASDIATGSSPTAVSIVKRMTWGRMMDEGEFYRAIYEDDDAIGWAIKGPDAAEGNAAFFEKRTANWVDVDPDALPDFGRRNANPFGIG